MFVEVGLGIMGNTSINSDYNYLLISSFSLIKSKLIRLMVSLVHPLSFIIVIDRVSNHTSSLDWLIDIVLISGRR